MSDPAWEDAGLTAAPPLLAGFAEIDISPPLGTQIAGDIGRPRPTEEIREPIFCRAAVFEQEDRRLCLLVLDVLGISHERSDQIRDGVAERLGFDRRAVMVHTTQTHSAPSVGCLGDQNGFIPSELDWLRGDTPEYDESTVAKCLGAVERAVAAVRPVLLAAGRGIETRVSFNRRFVTRDGVISTHALCGPDNVMYTEGPIDPEVGILQAIGEDGDPIGMLLHFTSHPALGYPERYISPEWCGHWVNEMKATSGGTAIPMVVNGCCGNVYEQDRLAGTGPESDMQMASVLAQTSLRIADALRPLPGTPIGFATRNIELPLRKVDPEMIRKAREHLKRFPTPQWRQEEPESVEWEWLYAIGRLQLEQMRNESPTFSYEIQAFRIGDLALVALSGEPFVEGQLNIKLRSPAELTFVAHMSNGFAGYIPTSHGLRGGGYESDTGMGSRYAGEALGMIVDGSVELIADLYQRPPRTPAVQVAV